MAVTAVTVTVMTTAMSGCAQNERATVAIVTDDGHRLTLGVEVASSRGSQGRGLAGRSDVPEGTGMLFPFTGPNRSQHVWMAGMHIPIDIAWIADGQITQVRTLQPCRQGDRTECPKWGSPGPVDALLEAKAGALNSVHPGATVTVDTGDPE